MEYSKRSAASGVVEEGREGDSENIEWELRGMRYELSTQSRSAYYSQAESQPRSRSRRSGCASGCVVPVEWSITVRESLRTYACAALLYCN